MANTDCALKGLKSFPDIGSFNSYINPLKLVLLLPQFQRWEKWQKRSKYFAWGHIASEPDCECPANTTDVQCCGMKTQNSAILQKNLYSLPYDFFKWRFFLKEGKTEVHKCHQKCYYREPNFYHLFAFPHQHYNFMNLWILSVLSGVVRVDLMWNAVGKSNYSPYFWLCQMSEPQNGLILSNN